jgi:uncharacterized membrane protein YdjX (TVP38/TMEM64 family)
VKIFRLFFILMAATALAAAFFAYRHFVTLQHFIEAVNSVRGNPWAGLIFVTTYLAFCLFAPISLFPVAGGVLFGFWKGLLYNALAPNGGALLAFYLARHFRSRFIGQFPPGRVSDFNDRVRRHGRFTMFSIRILGFPPFLITNYLAGLSAIRTSDYVIGTFFGMLPWKIAVTYFSTTLWAVLETAGMHGFEVAVRRFVWPIAGVFLSVAVLIALTAALKSRRSKDLGLTN